MFRRSTWPDPARTLFTDKTLIELLAPLTSAADLPSHASLSVPYLSNTLSDMVQQACDMLHREKRTLWSIKGLLTKLRGDETWIPCGNLSSEVDDIIFNTTSIYDGIVKLRVHQDSTNDTVKINSGDGIGGTPTPMAPEPMSNVGTVAANASSTGASKASNLIPLATAESDILSELPETITFGANEAKDVKSEEEPVGQADNLGLLDESAPAEIFPVPAADAVRDHCGNEDRLAGANQPMKLESVTTEQATTSADSKGSPQATNMNQDHSDEAAPEQESSAGEKVPCTVLDGDENAHIGQDLAPDLDEEKALETVYRTGEDPSQPPPHRMTTRAQAQAASEKSTASRTRSASVASSVPPPIHPLFLIPQHAHPDRDFGLSPNEAEEMRRTVMLYVQKQEEICRGAEKLYYGLLKADRMRKTVFKWCKAEGHVGEMSDGEDWYDKEEWGLDEDLRKGHDEEEEDANQGKKTRARRT